MKNNIEMYEVDCQTCSCVKNNDNTIFFWNSLNHSICSYDILTNLIKEIIMVSLDDIGDFKGENIYKIQNSIYIADQICLRVLKIDLLSKEFKLFKASDSNFSEYLTFKNNEKIVFIPSNISKGTFEFNSITGEFTEVMWNKDNLSSVSRSYIENMGEYVIFSIYDSSLLIKMKKDDYSYEIINFEHVDSLGPVYSEHKDSIWCISNNNSLVHLQENAFERFKILDISIDNAFSKIVFINDKIVCIPSRLQEIVLFDTIQHKVQKIKIDDEKLDTFGASCCYSYVICNNQIILLPHIMSEVFKIDLSDYSFEKYKIKVNENDIKQYMSGYYTRESGRNSLECFIDLVSAF